MERVDAGERVRLVRRKSGEQWKYTLEKLEGGGWTICAHGGDPQAPAACSTGTPIWAGEYVPPPRLILFGHGPDIVPIIALARSIGFRPIVVDWRPSAAESDRLRGVETIIGDTPELVPALNIGSRDYILICSHQFRRDRDFLERILPLAPIYVGIIGSRSRIRLMLDGLAVPNTVHAPVGLPIGADGPQEIAISIAAELILVKRGTQRSKEGNTLENNRNLSGSRNEPTHGQVQTDH